MGCIVRAVQNVQMTLFLLCAWLASLSWCQPPERPPFQKGLPLEKPAQPGHRHILPNYFSSALRIPHRGHSKQEVVDYAVDLLWRASDVYWHKGDYDSAIRLHRASFTLDPSFVEAYGVCAWLLESQGKSLELEGAELERQGKKHEAALKKQASEAKVKEALAVMHLSVKNNPWRYESCFELGNFYFRRREYSKALPWLEKAAALPCPFTVKHILAHAYERSGKLQEALRVWEERLKQEPNNDVVRRNLARVKRKLMDRGTKGD